MPADALKVFISSSMSELADERQVIRSTLQELGLTPFAWENDAEAQAGSPKEVWERELHDSHVCLVVLWRKLGEWTVDEIEIARAIDRPVLMFHKIAEVAGDADEVEPDEASPFVARVSHPEKGWITPKQFREPVELREYVPASLNKLTAALFEKARTATIEGGAGVPGAGRVAVEAEGGDGWKVDEAPTAGARRIPDAAVKRLDRHDGAFIGRSGERKRFGQLLGAGERFIRLIGPRAVGRESLLRAVTHGDIERPFPDGVGVQPAQSAAEGVEDLRQAVWERFYDPEQPGSVDVRARERDLLGLEAFVVLLDVGLDASQLAELGDALPKCVFGLTMPEQAEVSGRYITLAGFTDPSDQIALFADRALFGDPVPDGLHDDVAALCAHVGGLPGEIRALGDRANNELAGGMSLADWLAAVRAEQEAGS